MVRFIIIYGIIIIYFSVPFMVRSRFVTFNRLLELDAIPPGKDGNRKRGALSP